ncbi:MAG: DUF1559 family PulG-like putative transporter [Thermoguttaceae bacterium]
MRRWLWWVTVPAAGLVVVVGGWLLFVGGKDPGPQPPRLSVPPVAAPDNLPQTPVAVLPEYDDRWVPNLPEFVLNLDIAGNDAAGQLAGLLKAVPPLRHAMIDELFEGFGLKPAAVRRLSWASPDLSDWAARGIVVISLTEGQSAARLRSAGTAAPWQAGGLEFRRLGRPTWDRPFAVLDDRTIVTGDEKLLQQVAHRGDGAAELGGLSPLLTVAPADADFFLALNLHAAARAGWPMPTQWLDVWPQGRDSWRLIWSLPTALSFSYDRADLALAELGLLCEGETVADKVRVALEGWIPQAKSVVSARLEELAAAADGQPVAASLGPYRVALAGASEALGTAHLEVANRCVWLRADCGSDSSTWTTALADSRGAVAAEWYRAAGSVDSALQARLHEALSGYEQTEKKATPGAINSGPLPPDKVLSWITAMLPYLGHAPWTEDLSTSYSWDSPKNRPVTTRTLDEVQNPAVGVRETPSGFPVTHYVGVAGLGADAADLPRTDPRAGVFGHRESRRLGDVPDGASNTIATVGVSDKLGSWASGGGATVRGFVQKPYVNGPDGFGSGQPGGMYAGMADGSSRFLSADIDPTVLEQLVTAAGGERAAVLQPAGDQVVRVEPRPAVPAEMDRQTTEKPPSTPPEESSPAPPAAKVETPPAVDLAERLQMPLSGIAVTESPLQQALGPLESFGSFLVTFDLDTMSALGIPLDKPVSARLTDTTVGQALDSVLSSCGLKPVVRGNRLWVTGAGQASETARTVRYSVDDLASPGGSPASDLASWIPRLVAPETWQGKGGQGVIRQSGGSLEVTQTEAVHLEILVFCEKLRVARGLSPRSGQPVERFALATRQMRAATALQQPITANFFRPTAFTRVLQELSHKGTLRIAVNWLELDKEDKPPGLPAVLSVAQIPLVHALGQMLDPLGLDFRVIDERTLEVTTRAAADAHQEREFYRIGHLLDAGQNAAVLIDRLQREVAPGTWDSQGGQGAVMFDAASRCLVVLQNQRAHVAIEPWLQAPDGQANAAAAGGSKE